VQAFIKVGDTAVEHRVDPALFNLVDKLQDELAKEGKKTAVRHYQNILQLHASFWANADTLHVAVVVGANTEDGRDDLCGVRGQDPASVGGGYNGLPEAGRGHAPGSPCTAANARCTILVFF
jgi:hypothetical protein